MVCWVCVQAAHLNGVDHVVSVQAGPQLVDRRPVDVLQPREETSVQVEPVLLQAEQVVALHQLLQLIDDLIHLHAHCMVNIHLCVQDNSPSKSSYPEAFLFVSLNFTVQVFEGGGEAAVNQVLSHVLVRPLHGRPHVDGFPLWQIA